MSESNSVRVSLVQRTDFDTAAALNMLTLLTTGQSLRNNVTYQQSQTLRTDANVQDLIRTNGAVSGSLPMELVFPVASEALWYLLRAVMRTTETAAATQVTGVSCTGSAFVLSGGSGNVETGVEVGDILRVLTSADAAFGNEFYKVTAVNTGAHTVTVETAFPSDSTTLKVQRGARMKNGTDRYYYDAQVSRLDAGLYELFEKLVVNSLDISIADQAITTATFGVLGVTSTRDTSDLCLGHTSPTVGTVLDALGVPVFHVGGAEYSAKSISLSINNNIRGRTEIGTFGSQGYSWGSFDVKTRVGTFLDNWTDINNYVAGTETDLWFVLKDAAGQALSFSIPAQKWTELAADTRGLNQDDLQEGGGQAKIDATELISLRVQRWV